MSCVLATGNVPEILDLPYTASGKVKEMSKFPGAGNVHATRKNLTFPKVLIVKDTCRTYTLCSCWHNCML